MTTNDAGGSAVPAGDLNDFTRGQLQAGEFSSVNAPSVNADPVGRQQYLAQGRVTEYDRFGKPTDELEELLPNPHQVIDLLLVQRHHGTDACVNKKVSGVFVHRPQAAEKM